jgi:hypothetical protein
MYDAVSPFFGRVHEDELRVVVGRPERLMSSELSLRRARRRRRRSRR